MRRYISSSNNKAALVTIPKMNRRNATTPAMHLLNKPRWDESESETENERTNESARERKVSRLDYMVHSGMQFKDENDKKQPPLREWLVRPDTPCRCWHPLALPGSLREWPERSVTEALELPLLTWRFGALVPPEGTKWSAPTCESCGRDFSNSSGGALNNSGTFEDDWDKLIQTKTLIAFLRREA